MREKPDISSLVGSCEEYEYFQHFHNICAICDYILENGIAKLLDFLTVYHEDYPWIPQSFQEIEYPFEIIPENVVQCGPIFLSTAPASEQDPELANWLKKAPTVLIDLGSSVNYDEVGAV